jgi:pimeloyl-ACP methyl ester carboxylesterase
MSSTPTPIPAKSGHLDADGHRIWWEYHGDGSRETICLLNGLAMHTEAWYGFLPQLLPQYDVLLYDYPGQGKTIAEDVPCYINRFADYLARIADGLGVERLHVMGISYGGFVALEFGRQHRHRLHTLTISGILLSHEKLFDMYQDISLRFYNSGPEVFELYTHYMYEKIFGEDFVLRIGQSLETMRGRFHERYKDRTRALVRLTEAQNPFFGALDENMAGYRAIDVPTLFMPGAQDRCIPPWVQEKVSRILPNTRWMPIEDAGHVVYIEKTSQFFEALRRFMRAKSVDFTAP